MTFDPQTFRQTMRLWATGVTVVSVRHGDAMRGTTVSSFTSVTLDPPLILVCLQKTTDTAELIIQSGAFSVSMLGEDHQYLSNLFAGFADIPAEANRFEGIDLITADTGAPIIAGAMGWLDCRLHAIHDGSTHHIFIGQVMAASGHHDHDPMPLIYYNREYRRIDR
jgi:flavin reductase (DIM6/NTAB) family NADH-FMN oxidoreductase RutF